MGHTYTQLLYHIVFSTKDRRPWLTAEIRERVFDYLGGAIRSEGEHLILVGGVDDHVHLFTKLRQDKSISDVIRDIKANSSGSFDDNEYAKDYLLSFSGQQFGQGSSSPVAGQM